MSARERAARAAQEDAIERLRDQLCLPAELPSLAQALTHPSFANERGGQGREDNQRLEFLGDAVLGLCVSELLMDRFVGVDEGELTVMRASLVNTRALAEVARQVGLGAALRLGRGADQAGERESTNVLADALEAVVGAVYLDAGLPAARALSRIMVARKLAGLVARGGIERDPKSRLQELLQGRGLPPPRYRVVETRGPAHQKSFRVEVEVEVDGSESEPVVTGTGEGRSKKLAERAAAREALAVLDEDGAGR